MDRYSKSSEGIHLGSKIPQSSFNPSPTTTTTQPSSTSQTNHSTQTANEHVRLNSNSNSNSTITNSSSSPSSNNKGYRQVGRVGPRMKNDNNSHLRDEMSMATNDQAVEQQLQNSQFYQRGLHDCLKTQNSSSSNSGGRRGRGVSKVESDDEDDAVAVATDEDEEINRKLDPYMYDNVQYS